MAVDLIGQRPVIGQNLKWGSRIISCHVLSIGLPEDSASPENLSFLIKLVSNRLLRFLALD